MQLQAQRSPPDPALDHQQLSMLKAELRHLVPSSLFFFIITLKPRV